MTISEHCETEHRIICMIFMCIAQLDVSLSEHSCATVLCCYGDCRHSDGVVMTAADDGKLLSCVVTVPGLTPVVAQVAINVNCTL